LVTETKDKVDVLIQDDCHITRRLFTAEGIGKPTGMANIRELGYRKVCASWVLKMLTIKHTSAPKNTCAEYLQHSEED
jgi:hypothetical protein